MLQKTLKRAALALCALLLLMGLCTAASAQEEGLNTVEVFSVDEFLDAIAPNTQIVLAAGEYNLTDAVNYSRGGGDYYHWEGGYDGYELVITDVENLSIVSADPMAVTISTEPRYANVLRFDNVKGLQLTNLVVGHTREQGACIGGVLYLEDCEDVEISGSRLYGCGILGISLNACRNVHVDGCDVYECSYGCVEVSQSENVLFENSKFYDCEIVLEGFAIHSSQDVAIINSEIFNNRGDMFSTLFAVDCPGVYLGGLDVHNNEAEAIFTANGTPVTVESCRFNNGAGWAQGSIPAVSAQGDPLSAADLDSMKMRAVTWQPQGGPELPEVSAGEDGKIHVSTVDEFLAALGSDVTIYLEPGEYDLVKSATYGGRGGLYFRWEQVFDGYELVIEGADNLTIEAESPDTVSIVTEPRYANVLSFYNLTGLTVRNIKVGHTIEPGTCTGGVVRLESVSDASVEGCKLYGCGTLGVDATYCVRLNVTGCEIYECSWGAAWFHSCDIVRVEQCDVHDIGEEGEDVWVFYASESCYDVQVDGQPLETPD